MAKTSRHRRADSSAERARRRSRALLRWGIALPLALGFGGIALNALLLALGVDLIAVRDLTRALLALPLLLLLALGWAFIATR